MQQKHISQNQNHISRRRFALVAGAAAPVATARAERISVQDVITRLQTELGGDWPANGPDGFKAGDPSIAVTGIATTAMATVDVLKQAAAARANLILTYEPTFFGRADGRALDPGDPVYKAKQEFIAKNSLVVFRLRDHWQARKENDMAAGLAEALGWSAYRVNSDAPFYEIPAATAEDAVAWIRRKLNLRGGLRAAGDRKAIVRRVLLHPGSMIPATMWRQYSETDLIVAGEVREWENTHYAADIHTAGGKRALVTIGRIASEDPGMRVCAGWLKKVVNQVPVRWVGAGDPYWRAV